MASAIECVKHRFNAASIEEKNVFNAIRTAMFAGILRPIGNADRELAYKKIVEVLRQRRIMNIAEGGTFFMYNGNRLGFKPLVVPNSDGKPIIKFAPEVALPGVKKCIVSDNLRSHFVGSGAPGEHIYIGFTKDACEEIAIITKVLDDNYHSTLYRPMAPLMDKPVLSSDHYALFIVAAKFLDNEFNQYQ